MAAPPLAFLHVGTSAPLARVTQSGGGELPKCQLVPFCCEYMHTDQDTRRPSMILVISDLQSVWRQPSVIYSQIVLRYVLGYIYTSVKRPAMMLKLSLFYNLY